VSVHLILVFVQLCFASAAVVGKVALWSVPPGALVLARVAGGAVAFLLIAGDPRPQPPLTRGEVVRLLVALHLGIFINQSLFLAGLARSTAINASVINTVIPVVATALAMATGAEPGSRRRFAGITVGWVGALVAARVDRFNVGEVKVIGDLMLLGNATAYAVFLVVVRPLAQRIRPMALAGLLFLGAVPASSILGVPAWLELAPRLTGREAALIAFMVLVPTVLAYGLIQVALTRAPTSLVAIYIYVQPILASVAAAVLLHEAPQGRTFVAAALIFTGVWLCARAQAPPPAHPPGRGAPPRDPTTRPGTATAGGR